MTICTANGCNYHKDCKRSRKLYGEIDTKKVSIMRPPSITPCEFYIKLNKGK